MLILTRRPSGYWQCYAKRLTKSLLESAAIATGLYRNPIEVKTEIGGAGAHLGMDDILFERSPGVLCRLPQSDSQIALAEVYENVEYINHKIEKLERERDEIDAELGQLFSQRTSKGVPGAVPDLENELRYCAACGRNVVNVIIRPLCGRCRKKQD